MPDPPRPPQRRPPSASRLPAIVDQRPEPSAIGDRRDTPHVSQTGRRQTLSGVSAQVPQVAPPSPAPSEGAQGAEAAVTADTASEVRESFAGDHTSELLRENARLRKREAEQAQTIVELERRARVQTEIRSPSPFPPAIVDREFPQQPSAHQGRTGESGAPGERGVRGDRGDRGTQGERGAPASKLSHLPAVLLGAAGLVTALGTAFRPDTSKDQAAYAKMEQAYAAIREELVKQNAAIAKNGADDELRWNFTVGLFKATGDVKVTEAPGAPKIEPLSVAPAPLTNKVSPGSAPAIQIRDTLPPPVPSVAPVRLPVTLDSLKSQP